MRWSIAMVCRYVALSTGEAHDIRLAGRLLSRLKSGSMLLADRGYDADWIRELAMKKGAWAISRRKSIAATRSASALISIELATRSSGSSTGSNNVGGWRRATRLAADYLAFVQLASIRLWLRLYESASQHREVRQIV
ncbi:transposase [Bradyrhizobium sp. UFLA05-153]